MAESRRLSLPRASYNLDEESLRKQEEELKRKHQEVERRKEEAEKKAAEFYKKGGTPLTRTPPGRSQSEERKEKIDKGKKRINSSPADPKHEEQEAKKCKEVDKDEEDDEEDTIDDDLQEKQERLLQQYSESTIEIDKIFSKPKSGKESIRKIKLKMIGYLMKIASLEGRLAEQQDANDSLKEIIHRERNEFKDEIRTLQDKIKTKEYQQTKGGEKEVELQATLKQMEKEIEYLRKKVDDQMGQITKKAKIEGKIERVEEENTQLKQKTEEQNKKLLQAEVVNTELRLRLEDERKTNNRQTKEQEELRKKVEELRKNEQELLSKTLPQATFADVLKRQPPSERAQKIAQVAEKEKPSIFIRPRAGETLAQLRSSWEETINPEKDKVRATIFTGKKVMVVQADTREDINRII